LNAMGANCGCLGTQAFRASVRYEERRRPAQRADSESRELFTIQSQVPIAAVPLPSLRYVRSSSPLVPCRRTADIPGFFELSTFVTSEVARIRSRFDEFSCCSLTHMNPQQTCATPIPRWDATIKGCVASFAHHRALVL